MICWVIHYGLSFLNLVLISIDLGVILGFQGIPPYLRSFLFSGSPVFWFDYRNLMLHHLELNQWDFVSRTDFAGYPDTINFINLNIRSLRKNQILFLDASMISLSSFAPVWPLKWVYQKFSQAFLLIVDRVLKLFPLVNWSGGGSVRCWRLFILSALKEKLELWRSGIDLWWLADRSLAADHLAPWAAHPGRSHISRSPSILPGPLCRGLYLPLLCRERGFRGPLQKDWHLILHVL